ncbi:uro-adherence factor A-like isoform X2 [Macrobrachium rosenbergii]
MGLLRCSLCSMWVQNSGMSLHLRKFHGIIKVNKNATSLGELSSDNNAEATPKPVKSYVIKVSGQTVSAGQPLGGSSSNKSNNNIEVTSSASLTKPAYKLITSDGKVYPNIRLQNSSGGIGGKIIVRPSVPFNNGVPVVTYGPRIIMKANRNISDGKIRMPISSKTGMCKVLPAGSAVLQNSPPFAKSVSGVTTVQISGGNIVATTSSNKLSKMKTKLCAELGKPLINVDKKIISRTYKVVEKCPSNKTLSGKNVDLERTNKNKSTNVGVETTVKSPGEKSEASHTRTKGVSNKKKELMLDMEGPDEKLAFLKFNHCDDIFEEFALSLEKIQKEKESLAKKGKPNTKQKSVLPVSTQSIVPREKGDCNGKAERSKPVSNKKRRKQVLKPVLEPGGDVNMETPITNKVKVRKKGKNVLTDSECHTPKVGKRTSPTISVNPKKYGRKFKENKCDTPKCTPKTSHQTPKGKRGGGKKKRPVGRPRREEVSEVSTPNLSGLDTMFNEQSHEDVENEPVLSPKHEEEENIPTVELDLFTLSSLNEKVSVLLTEPHNPDFKVYASMDAIFVGDSALGDVTNQIGYVTDSNNVVFVNPGHFLFPNVQELDKFVPSSILTVKEKMNLSPRKLCKRATDGKLSVISKENQYVNESPKGMEHNQESQGNNKRESKISPAKKKTSIADSKVHSYTGPKKSLKDKSLGLMVSSSDVARDSKENVPLARMDGSSGNSKDVRVRRRSARYSGENKGDEQMPSILTKDEELSSAEIEIKKGEPRSRRMSESLKLGRNVQVKHLIDDQGKEESVDCDKVLKVVISPIKSEFQSLVQELKEGLLKSSEKHRVALLFDGDCPERIPYKKKLDCNFKDSNVRSEDNDTVILSKQRLRTRSADSVPCGKGSRANPLPSDISSNTYNRLSRRKGRLKSESDSSFRTQHNSEETEISEQALKMTVLSQSRPEFRNSGSTSENNSDGVSRNGRRKSLSKSTSESLSEEDSSTAVTALAENSVIKGKNFDIKNEPSVIRNRPVRERRPSSKWLESLAFGKCSKKLSTPKLRTERSLSDTSDQSSSGKLGNNGESAKTLDMKKLRDEVRSLTIISRNQNGGPGIATNNKDVNVDSVLCDSEISECIQSKVYNSNVGHKSIDHNETSAVLAKSKAESNDDWEKGSEMVEDSVGDLLDIDRAGNLKNSVEDETRDTEVSHEEEFLCKIDGSQKLNLQQKTKKKKHKTIQYNTHVESIIDEMVVEADNKMTVGTIIDSEAINQDKKEKLLEGGMDEDKMKCTVGNIDDCKELGVCFEEVEDETDINVKSEKQEQPLEKGTKGVATEVCSLMKCDGQVSGLRIEQKVTQNDEGTECRELSLQHDRRDKKNDSLDDVFTSTVTKLDLSESLEYSGELNCEGTTLVSEDSLCKSVSGKEISSVDSSGESTAESCTGEFLTSSEESSTEQSLSIAEDDEVVVQRKYKVDLCKSTLLSKVIRIDEEISIKVNQEEQANIFYTLNKGDLSDEGPDSPDGARKFTDFEEDKLLEEILDEPENSPQEKLNFVEELEKSSNRKGLLKCDKNTEGLVKHRPNTHAKLEENRNQSMMSTFSEFEGVESDWNEDSESEEVPWTNHEKSELRDHKFLNNLEDNHKISDFLVNDTLVGNQKEEIVCKDERSTKLDLTQEGMECKIKSCDAGFLSQPTSDFMAYPEDGCENDVSSNVVGNLEKTVEKSITNVKLPEAASSTKVSEEVNIEVPVNPKINFENTPAGSFDSSEETIKKEASTRDLQLQEEGKDTDIHEEICKEDDAGEKISEKILGKEILNDTEMCMKEVPTNIGNSVIKRDVSPRLSKELSIVCSDSSTVGSRSPPGKREKCRSPRATGPLSPLKTSPPLCPSREWHGRGAKLKAQVLIQDQQSGVTTQVLIHDQQTGVTSSERGKHSPRSTAHSPLKISPELSPPREWHGRGAKLKAQVLIQDQQTYVTDSEKERHSPKSTTDLSPLKVSPELSSPREWHGRGAKLKAQVLIQDQQTYVTDSERERHSPKSTTDLSPLKVSPKSTTDLSPLKVSPELSSPREWHGRGAKLKAQVLIQDQQTGVIDSHVVCSSLGISDVKGFGTDGLDDKSGAHVKSEKDKTSSSAKITSPKASGVSHCNTGVSVKSPKPPKLVHDDRKWQARGAKLKAQIMISDQQNGQMNTLVEPMDKCYSPVLKSPPAKKAKLGSPPVNMKDIRSFFTVQKPSEQKFKKGVSGSDATPKSSSSTQANNLIADSPSSPSSASSSSAWKIRSPSADFTNKHSLLDDIASDEKSFVKANPVTKPNDKHKWNGTIIHHNESDNWSGRMVSHIAASSTMLVSPDNSKSSEPNHKVSPHSAETSCMPLSPSTGNSTFVKPELHSLGSTKLLSSPQCITDSSNRDSPQTFRRRKLKLYSVTSSDIRTFFAPVKSVKRKLESAPPIDCKAVKWEEESSLLKLPKTADVPEIHPLQTTCHPSKIISEKFQTLDSETSPDFEGFLYGSRQSGVRARTLVRLITLIKNKKWYGLGNFPFPLDQLCDWNDGMLEDRLFDKHS